MSNSVSRSYSKHNQDTSLCEETLCLCPPETSPLDEVGGGILSRHASLAETVPVISYPVNGCSQPLNLE